MFNINEGDSLYDQVSEMVDQAMAAVLSEASITDGNLDLEEAIASSKTLLKNFRDKTTEDIQELRELAEWDTFTIAFYGETNAGKSTLIETLRILLGDSEKLATQQRFKDMAEELRVDPGSLVNLELAIGQLELQLSENQDHSEILKQKLRAEQQEHEVQVETLKTTIMYKRKNMSLWQKLVFLFKKLAEENELLTQKVNFTQSKAGYKIQLEDISAVSLKLSAELSERHTDRASMKSSFMLLAPLQDGNIIGNGSSDFTLQSSAYCFTANSQKFQLVDVPGIEGDEKQVMGAIEASVKKAHAVFYVTRAATPPGSGSDGQEGTVDKIKRQLGKQTEVWAIYNKSATSPQVLLGKTLVNQNDSIGLADMDKSLTYTLGAETYKGHICVSGMPAFLASASCFVPDNPHVKTREKFLTAMSPADILERSGMDAFLQFIRTEICQNFQKKIAEANLKKVRSCLQEGVEHLHQARDNFANAAQKLKVQQESAALQIDALLSGTSQKLRIECHDQLTEKKSSMRRAIYDYIEGDNSNDDFKERLTADVEELKTSIGMDLEARFTKVLETFNHEAGEIIKKNQKNVDEILRYTINDPFSSLKLSFDTEFKMDNGINVLGIISTLGSAASFVLMAFLGSNPVGWTIWAVINAVGLVFSFYKAVRSFFSSDYKKEQQRKSVNDNLDKVFVKLTEMLNHNLESAGDKVKEVLLDTKKQLGMPYEQSVNTKTALEGVAAKMEALRDKLTLPTAVAAI